MRQRPRAITLVLCLTTVTALGPPQASQGAPKGRTEDAPPSDSPSESRTWCVSPNATGQGDGSRLAPWTLMQAFTSTALRPGDTVQLLAGEYLGTNFVVTTRGTAAAPIRFLGYGARLNQGSGSNKTVLMLDGDYTELHGLEIYSTNTKRTGFEAGSWANNQCGTCINDNGRGNGVYHCYLHDNATGLLSYAAATGSTYAGNVICNNGWVGPDRPHGPGIYTQNESPERKRILANAVFANFGAGFEVYTKNSQVQNFDLMGNTSFITSAATGNRSWNWVLAGESDGNVIARLRTWAYPHDTSWTGQTGFGSDHPGTPLGDLTVTDSVFAHGSPVAQVLAPSRLTWQRNRMVSTAAGTQYAFRFWQQGGEALFGGNTLYVLPPGRIAVESGASAARREFRVVEWAEFQAQYPSAAADALVRAKPAEPWVYVEKSPVRDDWRLVTVYNWSGAASAPLDVSDLPPGEYVVSNVQAYKTPLAWFTAAPGSIALPLAVGEVTQPIGNAPAKVRPTLPEFGCFVVQQRKYLK